MTEGFQVFRPCRLRLVIGLAVAILPLAILHSSLTADDGGAPSAYQPPSPEPTPWETLILEYINRCRANPAADAELCITSKRVPGSVEVDMFRREMYAEKPAPPMVFDLSLLKAARAHSYYQILNDQTHTETEGKPGFYRSNALRPSARSGLFGRQRGEHFSRRPGSLVFARWICRRLGRGPGRNAAGARSSTEHPQPQLSCRRLRRSGSSRDEDICRDAQLCHDTQTHGRRRNYQGWQPKRLLRPW